jgi:hypothetical protein
MSHEDVNRQYIYTLAEIADLLEMSERTVYRYIEIF